MRPDPRPGARAAALALAAVLWLSLSACSGDSQKRKDEQVFLDRVNAACVQATKDLPKSVDAQTATSDTTAAERQLLSAAVAAFKIERQTLEALIPPSSLQVTYTSEVLAGLRTIETQYLVVLNEKKVADPKKLLADAKAAYGQLRVFYTRHKVNACLAGIPKNV